MEIKGIRSIKSKLLRGSVLIILSTVIVLNILLWGFIRRYYYDNMEGILKGRIEISINFYKKYFSSKSLIENIYDNIDAFWDGNNAQVEIFDSKGSLLMDSIGIKDKKLINGSDVHKALEGEISRWIGKADYFNEKLMAVSYPIIIEDEIIGVIRFITSLEEVDMIIKNIMIVFSTISLVVVFLSVIFTIILANSIINPLKYLNKIAEKMGNGNLNIRSKITSKDEIGKLSDTLNFMANEISRKEQLKNDFISQVSHELRTPLTSIKGWTITLNNEETDKETLEMGFEIIEKETDRLTTMVEELLDFSRLINENVKLDLEYVYIPDFIYHIESFMKARAIKEKLDFIVKNECDFSVFIDNNRMKQVFINLLDNAFKFSSEDGVVYFKISKYEKSVVFIVEDEGCGVSEEDLPRIKDKFFKGKNSNSKNGIGLSICDEIIKLHKGKLNIHSNLGIGTKVEVIIPIKEEL